MSLYTPDWKIEKALKAHDRCLRILWNPNRQRWQVWRFVDSGQAYHIKTVNNDDGSFRPLDERLVAHIKAMDTWHRSVGDIVNEIDQFNSEVKKDLLNKRDSAIHGMVDERWSYIKKLREEMGTIRMSKEERIAADRQLEARIQQLEGE